MLLQKASRWELSGDEGNQGDIEDELEDREDSWDAFEHSNQSLWDKSFRPMPPIRRRARDAPTRFAQDQDSRRTMARTPWTGNAFSDDERPASRPQPSIGGTSLWPGNTFSDDEQPANNRTSPWAGNAFSDDEQPANNHTSLWAGNAFSDDEQPANNRTSPWPGNAFSDDEHPANNRQPWIGGTFSGDDEQPAAAHNNRDVDFDRFLSDDDFSDHRPNFVAPPHRPQPHRSSFVAAPQSSPRRQQPHRPQAANATTASVDPAPQRLVADPSHNNASPLDSLQPRKPVKQRPAALLKLQAQVRAHFGLLANVSIQDLDRPNNYPTASEHQVQLYTGSGGNPAHGPNLANCAYDKTRVKTPWNKALSRLFAASLRSHLIANGSPPAHIDEALIARVFLTRLKGIRAGVYLHKPENNKSLRARQTRKASMIFRREEAAKTWIHTDANLRHVLNIVQTLSAECHSDDQSDHEDGHHKYWAKDPAWRNPRLGQVFQVLDRLHIAQRFRPNGRITKGAWPHLRYHVARRAEPVNGLGPSGLPINFYDEGYLARLSHWQLLLINPGRPVPIKLSAALVRFSCRFEPPLRHKDRLPLEPDDPSLPPTIHGCINFV